MVYCWIELFSLGLPCVINGKATSVMTRDWSMEHENGANPIVTLLEPSRAPITVKQIMVTMTKSSKPKQMPGLFQTSRHSSLNLQTHVLFTSWSHNWEFVILASLPSIPSAIEEMLVGKNIWDRSNSIVSNSIVLLCWELLQRPSANLKAIWRLQFKPPLLP